MPRRPAPHRGTEIHYGDADDDAPSKTVLKAQSHALQVLGRELTELPADRLAAVPMPDPLRDAITTYQRTRSHEGRRRQMQYIGKLMRSADEAPLREAVAAASLGSAKETLLLHETERWRGALIDDDEALTRWIAQFPDTDAQHLRSLVRAARRDRAAADLEQRQPKSFRELFQFIRPLLAQETSP
jgi:ribosome-associated protein